MNKTVIIVIAVLAVLLLGGGAFVMSQRSKPESTSTTQNNTNDTSTTPSSAAKSLVDLFNLGTAQQCSFSDGSTSSGTVYVSNQKMRGDFTYTVAQGTTNAHMIIDNGTSYIWTDGQTTGLKMKFDAATAAEDFDSKVTDNSVDINQKYDYDCKSWSIDQTKFTLPTGVQFTDLSGIFPSSLPSSGSGTTDTKALQCAACNSLPTEAQAACKSALSCN